MIPTSGQPAAKTKDNNENSQDVGTNNQVCLQEQRQADDISTTNPNEHQEEIRFRVSKRRWGILLGICTFGVLNGICNETNSILKVYVELLDVSLDTYVYLCQIFLYVPLVVSIPSAWFLDRFGLKATVYAAMLLTVLRNSSRAVLFSAQLPYWKQNRLAYWAVQQFTTAFVVTIYYCLPLKISENWFNEKERSTAWTLILVLPTIGSALAQLVVPHFVTSAQTVQPLAYLNVISLVVTCVACLATITKSRPTHSPSKRSSQSARVDSEPMLVKLRRLLTHWNIMIQMFVLITFDSLNATINSLLQDIFASAGMSQVFCGQFLAASAIVSFAFQLIGSSRLTKKRQRRQQQAAQAIAARAKQKELEDSGSSNELEQSSDSTIAVNVSASRQHLIDADSEEKTKTRTCKINVILICFAFQIYATSLNFHKSPIAFLAHNQWLLVMSGSLLYTCFRCWSAPQFNDISAQLISGLVSEATLSAFGSVANGILTNIYSVAFVKLRRQEDYGRVDVVGDGGGGETSREARSLNASDHTSLSPTLIIEETGDTSTLLGGENFILDLVPTTKESVDYYYSILFASIMVIFATFIYLICFDGKRPEMPTTPARPSVEEGGGPADSVHRPAGAAPEGASQQQQRQPA